MACQKQQRYDRYVNNPYLGDKEMAVWIQNAHFLPDVIDSSETMVMGKVSLFHTPASLCCSAKEELEMSSKYELHTKEKISLILKKLAQIQGGSMAIKRLTEG